MHTNPGGRGFTVTSESLGQKSSSFDFSGLAKQKRYASLPARGETNGQTCASPAWDKNRNSTMYTNPGKKTQRVSSPLPAAGSIRQNKKKQVRCSFSHHSVAHRLTIMLLLLSY